MVLSSDHIKILLRDLKGNTKIYTPVKYFNGLASAKDVKNRYKRILRSKKGINYSPFETDTLKATKKSKYTTAFEKEYPYAKSIKEKSKATGIPYNILKEVYDKGLAAWSTGHRVGASAQQWGYARVHSFIMLGCTAYTADKYLVEKAIKSMKILDIKKWKSRKTLCKRKEINVFT
jgi:hypothetical protein